MLCDDQNKDSFEAKWPLIKPILNKLLNQETVKKFEWFNLFS